MRPGSAMPSYEKMEDAPGTSRSSCRERLGWALLGAALTACAVCAQSWRSLPAPGSARPAPSALAAKGVTSVRLKVGRTIYKGIETEWYGRRFKGIPYGKATRYRNPEDPDEIVGEYDATFFRASCMRGVSHRNETMSEDCHFLNIYTPIPWRNDITLEVPVLVWFHGGSFTMGAGSDSHVEDVEELVTTRRLVVVTINYRLGIFGFLGSERLRGRPQGSVGNYGTLDQQQALRWVQRHIQHFGGDARRIGLVGWSAGAASISVHLSMPSSQGLFSRAIMMSGGFADWASQTMDEAEAAYIKVLDLAGCAQSRPCLDAGPPCACLLEKTSAELLDAEAKAGVMWAPTVDGTRLAHHPMEALNLGKTLQGIPIIIGGAMEDALNDIGADATDADFQQYLTTARSEGGMGLPQAGALQAMRIYLQMVPPSYKGLDRWSAPYWAARRARADHTMNCVARRAAALWKSKTGADAHWYVWANKPVHRYPDPPKQDSKVKTFQIGGCWPCPGVTHGSDLPYLFEHPTVDVDDSLTDLADIYQVFFRNFFYALDPNNWKGEFLSQYWGGPYQLKAAWPSMPTAGMWFNAGESQAHGSLKAEECDFWDSLASR